MVKLLRSISPTRAIMGRLFLWFWATFIVTSLLAIWGSRLFFEDLQVVQIKPREVEDLNQAIERMQRGRFQDLPLHETLDRNSRGVRGRLVAVDIRDNRLISGGGPPLRDNDKEDLLRLVNQTSPIAVKRLEALIDKPNTDPVPKNYQNGGYLKGGKLPKDAWDNDFLYFFDKGQYEIISLGSDGSEGGEGDAADISSFNL